MTPSDPLPTDLAAAHAMILAQREMLTIARSEVTVSRAALAMLLNGDKAALGAYLSGDRASELVRAYFDGEAVKLTLTKTDPNCRVRVTDLRMPSKQPQSVAPGNARRLSVRSI